MKYHDFRDPFRKQFAQTINAADPRRQNWGLFLDWLSCAFWSLRQLNWKAHHNKELNPAYEEKYLQAIKRVRHPEKFAEAFQIVFQHYWQEGEANIARTDFLGHVLEEWGLLNRWAGQFFTPDTVCTLMAKMIIGTDIKKTGRIRVCEPACGSGRLAIAAVNEFIELDIPPWCIWIDCIDVDWKCFAITFIQLNLLGVPAAIHHANTLTNEIYDTVITTAGHVYPDISRIEDNYDPRKLSPDGTLRTLGQMSLFPDESKHKVPTFESTTDKGDHI